MIKDKFILFGVCSLLASVLVLIFMLCSCTISFTNISTHGTATDLLDEDQGASADVKADIPINPLRP